MTRKLIMKNGTEGDRHDPYAWTEYVVIHDKDRTELRCSGLGYLRLHHNGARVASAWDGDKSDEQFVLAEFKRLTGMTLVDFNRYYDRINPWWYDPIGHHSMYV